MVPKDLLCSNRNSPVMKATRSNMQHPSPPRTGWTAGLLVACLVGGAASPAAAGAWTKPQGGGYLKLGSATFSSWFTYDTEGVQKDSAPFLLRAQTLYGYGEVGITDWFTVVGFVPYIFSTNRHESGLSFHTAGLGDAMIGGQTRLLSTEVFTVSSRLELKVPLYRGGPSIEGRQSGTIPGLPRSTPFFPALGDGQVDITGFLSAGAGIPVVDGFVTVDVGFRHRTAGLTDAVIVQGAGGVFTLGRRVLLMINAVRIESMDKSSPFADEVVGKGFTSLGPAMSVFAWRGLALEVGCDFVFMGKNTAGGVQVLGGVSYGF